MSGENRYFEEALSDFIFDAASGGAIRHLADRGYSVEQIMKELDFPAPRERVEKTVYRHMIDTGMLRVSLPVEEESMRIQSCRQMTVYELTKYLSEHIGVNGEESSYMLCPFGTWLKNDKNKLNQVIACLTAREQEYIMGIRWERNIMYHRLNSRMLEIGAQLARNSEMDTRFYFLAERLIVEN